MIEEACKLLDNNWSVLLFRDSLGTYTAFAVREGKSVDAAIAEWRDDDGSDVAPDEATEALVEHAVFGGINRYQASGFSVSQALHALAEKVLFRRLPGKE